MDTRVPNAFIFNGGISMKTKSCSLPNWARCLCIACMIAVLAPPVAAQNPTIEWIKIYLNPTLQYESWLYLYTEFRWLWEIRSHRQ